MPVIKRPGPSKAASSRQCQSCGSARCSHKRYAGYSVGDPFQIQKQLPLLKGIKLLDVGTVGGHRFFQRIGDGVCCTAKGKPGLRRSSMPPPPGHRQHLQSVQACASGWKDHRKECGVRGMRPIRNRAKRSSRQNRQFVKKAFCVRSATMRSMVNFVHPVSDRSDLRRFLLKR